MYQQVMYQLTLSIHALEPLIFSHAPISMGQDTLEYIPGNALLGAAANSLYGDNLRDNKMLDNWRLFHSGEVIFGNAYPCLPHAPGLPAPLAWHAAKGASCLLERQ
ncbi:MAG: hypothetical protein P8176_16145, partial [Gammaproteobacteria bacterium]